MTSLRTRAISGGIVWATFAISIGVFGLISILDAQTQARFDKLLHNRHTQALIAVANNYDNPQGIDQDIGDAVYERPFSGEYWQVERDDGAIFVSPSLVDELLLQPVARGQGIRIGNFAGPNGGRVRAVAQWLTLEDGSAWYVQVASSLDSLVNERAILRKNLVLAFGLVAFVGIAGAFLLVSATLRPISTLRRDVLARHDNPDGLDDKAYPREVAPLVSDINTLLNRNREIVSRSRRQAADLAHAIKTPSAIVRNELEKLNHDGQPVTDAINALDRLDAQLKRSFARMRADGGHQADGVFTDVDHSLGRMARAFGALVANQDKTLTTDIDPGLRIRMDQSDFEEVMGNLLDNALKWSKSKLHVAAFRDDKDIVFLVEDDGPGIPEDAYGTATLSGQRLDTSTPGTGLGLAIAADLAHAYGGKVKLDRSQALGGLQAKIVLKP